MDVACFADLPASAQVKKPNILVIMSDDVGIWNISAYNRGMEGYRTPNIDRIAREGAIFTDYYSQQSCTAGRAAFITGQSPIRTGLTKVGLPGAKEGLSAKDPTIAELLRPKGYMTGQFGKNHLGDRNEFLPTVHGFDEFIGNLDHLNSEEEPENEDYPKDPQFLARFGPRGILKCKATTTESTAPPDRDSVHGENKPAKTPGRSRGSAWRPLTMSSSRLQRTSGTALARRANRSASQSHRELAHQGRSIFIAGT